MSYIRVFNHPIRAPYVALAAAEMVVLMMSVYLGIKIRLPDTIIDLSSFQDPFYPSAIVYSLTMLISTAALGVYDVRYREGFTSMAIRTVVSYCLLGMTALVVLFYLVPAIKMGRGVLSLSIVISLVNVLALRWVFFETVDRDALRRKVLILGAGKNAAQILNLLESESRPGGYLLLGCLPLGQQPVKVPEERLYQLSGPLAESVKNSGIDEIVVALDERRRSEGGDFPLNALLDCKMQGVTVQDAIEFCEREVGKIELSLISPAWMVFSQGFRFSRLRDFTKRAFDITICLILLILTLPFMLITAILVALDDGFPVLYRQTRTGLNGKPFTIYKFRSMRKDAEKNGAQWASKNDSRITRVGNFIRNTRLDELPQIYNVLKGDMSFVGPRPERPEFVEELAAQIPYYEERHRVKPGLMGWAQLKYPYGASVDDARQKLKYDLYYTKNHSLLLDILIVIQTVEVILLGKGVR